MPKANTGQALDPVPYGREHAPDLPLAALVNCDLHRAGVVLTGGGYQPCPCRGGQAIFEFDSSLDLRQIGRSDAASDNRQIDLLHLMRWVRHQLGELAVVGENQQAGCVNIQTANRVQKRVNVPNQFQDRVLRVRVRPGARIAGRLVEKDVELLRRGADRLAVKGDRVPVRVGLCAEFAYDLAVYGDSTASDQSFALTTRPDACGGEDLLQSLFQ